MKNKISLFMLIASLLTSLIIAQNNDAQTRNIQNHPDFIRYLQYGKTTPTKAVQVQKSEYFGLDKTLSAFFYYEQIPADFPKASETMQREDYIREMNNWFSSNQNRIKPEMKNKLFNQKGEIYEND